MRTAFSLLLLAVSLCLVATRPAHGDAPGTESAACSFTLRSLQLIGVTAAQLQYEYALPLSSSSKGGFELELALRGDKPPSTTHVKVGPLAPGQSIEIWSSKPLSSAAVESAFRSGGDALENCRQTSQIANADEADAKVTVFAHPRLLSAGVTVKPRGEQVTDAEFITKKPPDYPDRARDQGLIGDVVIEVTISPSGVHGEKVYKTSDVWEFDLEALKAARNSTYKPPSVERNYLIDYRFLLDPVPGDPFGYGCGASIGSFHLVRSIDGFHATLFDIDVNSSKTNLKLASLMLVNQVSNLGMVFSLPSVVFEPSAGTTLPGNRLKAPPTTHARVLWVGPAMDYVTLQHAVTVDNTTLDCDQRAVHALDEEGNAVNAPVTTNEAVSSGNAFLVLPARYESRVFPKYPAAAIQKDRGGCAELLVHALGAAPDRTEIIESSGNDGLDGAAADAARASLYRATTRSGTSQTEFYEATYCFDASNA